MAPRALRCDIRQDVGVPAAANEVLVPPDAGETIRDDERLQSALITSREQITITRYRMADGERGPDPHVHHEHTDAFYVLEGELSFLLGPARERVSVGAGGLVAAPPDLVHTFNNDTGAEARFLNFHTPDGGFGQFMRDSRDGNPDASFDTFDPPAAGGLPLSEAVISREGEGERLVSGNRLALLKAVLPHACFAEFELDGHFTGPEPHEHEARIDSFYVLDGELELTLGDGRHAAGPGTLASVPPNVRHTFGHPGGGTARFLNIHAPDGGFAGFLRRTSE
jgi:quercetin dioxygenase-like cupin family protein